MEYVVFGAFVLLSVLKIFIAFVLIGNDFFVVGIVKHILGAFGLLYDK